MKIMNLIILLQANILWGHTNAVPNIYEKKKSLLAQIEVECFGLGRRTPIIANLLNARAARFKFGSNMHF